MRWKLDWNHRYVINSYFEGSLWLAPFFTLVFFWVFSRLTRILGDWLIRSGRIDETTAFIGYTMTGARHMLDMVATANLSFLVFTFGSLLVAIQIAGGQYTPRIIATTLLRDNKIRYIVAYLLFTWLFAGNVTNRMSDTTVDQFNVFAAACFGIVSIVVFLYLIDYAARFLRPASIVARVGSLGLAIIEVLFPQPTRRVDPVDASGRPVSWPRSARADGASQGGGGVLRRILGLTVGNVNLTTPVRADEPVLPVSADRIVAHAGRSGVVLAVDRSGLVEMARRATGVIEFVPQVGDFVAVDEPLFQLYGGAAAIDDHALRASVAFGIERTIEQDPTFALRILVDIAIKALSPAINDPTTAVIAIDQLHRLLRQVGLRHLHDDYLRDHLGTVRFIFRTANWEDFVHLACTEIRHYGGGSVQIMRRMHSMLENLLHTLPPHRHAELRQQLALLDGTVAKHFTHREDRALARTPDPQGLGGSPRLRPVAEAANRK